MKTISINRKNVFASGKQLTYLEMKRLDYYDNAFFQKNIIIFVLLSVFLLFLFTDKLSVDIRIVPILKPIVLLFTFLIFLSIINFVYRKISFYLAMKKLLKNDSVHKIKEIHVIKFGEDGMVELYNGDASAPLGVNYPYENLSYDDAIEIIERYKQQ